MLCPPPRSCEPALCPSVFWGTEVQERWPRLWFVCFLITLLRYNPCTAQLSHIKYTRQWVLAHHQIHVQLPLQSISERSIAPKRMFATLKECSVTQKECSITPKECSVIPKGDPILFIFVDLIHSSHIFLLPNIR